MLRKSQSFLIACFGILFFGTASVGFGKEIPESVMDSFRLVNDYVDENEDCFRCHGETKFQLPNGVTDGGRTHVRHMARDHMVVREDFYISNHKSFACSDCHSSEFSEFPHSLEVRLEDPFTCLDCHGYDENYAHYNFETIEEEYMQSVHHLANPDGFSCWKCHPHSYHISIRNTENLETTIAYDNAICLSCHANFDEFELLTDRDGINIIQTHEWLPNQALHFRNVRCIECHTQVSDSILVAHLVQPKEKAVRLCSECHSRNSLLMATLYKFQSKEARGEYGFINAVVFNNSFVIGANRNYFLNVISLIIFGFCCFGVMIHIVFRIVNKV
ncbi:hypothetical protein ACFLTU_08440 [Bacteroidota bacterium]